ncbi:MAG TPA: hypothetical protein DD979_00740, partial [Gammaproteobacteria bacterium]|nr:hypothetical protein [Gammaproteobacteria bacterium]
PERIKALALRDYNVKMPGLCADPTVPKHLIDAGIQMPNCHAAIVLTSNEAVNVQIAVMVRLLSPELPIYCLSTQERFQDQLRALGGVVVINPFEIFAQLMSNAIAAPKLHNLNAFLVRTKTVKLGQPLNIPAGRWILCGYGRMGQWLHKYFVRQGIPTVIIAPDITPDHPECVVIKGLAHYQNLQKAGIAEAVGVIACTDDDHENLSILMCVQKLQPEAFTIVRQNRHENQIAFDAAHADLILQSSMTTARRILKHLISPYIQHLVDHLGAQGEVVTDQLIHRLKTTLEDRPAHLWCITINSTDAAALTAHLDEGHTLSLHGLLRDPHNLDGTLACVPLVMEHNGHCQMLPDDSQPLAPGDKVLFCGTRGSETLLAASMNNAYTLHYIIHGHEQPRGYVFQWLDNLRAQR